MMAVNDFTTLALLVKEASRQKKYDSSLIGRCESKVKNRTARCSFVTANDANDDEASMVA